MSLRPSHGSLVPVTVWTLFVVVLLVLPGDEVWDPGFDWMDKVAHALLFGVHFALLAPVLAARRLAGRPGVAAAVASGLFAVAMETVQLWVPGRGWEVWDLVAGFIGVAAAARWLERRRARLSARL